MSTPPRPRSGSWWSRAGWSSRTSELGGRLVGWLFGALYVTGGRYGCYNQSTYLSRHPSSLDRSVGFDWTLYQIMVSDRARVAAYRRDIARTVPGRRVLEVGPGPVALLTRLAVEAGAESVVSVEADPAVAERAANRLRRAGIAEQRARVMSVHSDHLHATELTDRDFDVLLLEAYHSIASQERVVETVAHLRRQGFRFDRVISREFHTLVVPAAAPPAAPMTAPERAALGWPWSARSAAAAMRSHPSTVYASAGVLAALRLAEPQVWQQCDLEADATLTTAAELTFDVAQVERYAGLLLWNRFAFHDEVLDTGQTRTEWGVFFLPLPVLTQPGAGRGQLVLSTATPDPERPSEVGLTARIGTNRSAPLWL